MKRMLAILLSVALCVACLAGCQTTTTEPTTATEAVTTEKLSVITTNFPPYDFVREIGGDLLDVTMLLQPGTESHSYDPTPQDIIAIQNCDLFLYTGGENDVWVDEILSTMGEDAPDTLRLLDCVDTVAEEYVEGMEHSHGEEDHDEEEHVHDDEEEHVHDDEEEHVHDDEEEHVHDDEEEHVHDDEEEHVHDDEEEHVHDEEEEHVHDDEEEHVHDDEEEHVHEEEVDEHVWTSLSNAAEIVTAITARLVEKDNANGSAYEANAEAYKLQLADLDSQFQEVVDNGVRTTLLFGDRFPFRYFADDYGLDYYAAFSGCSTETEASAATVAFLIDKTNELELPVVFTMELSSGLIAASICEATGAEQWMLHSCHNITKDEMAAGETYLSLMTANVDALNAALN